MNNWKTEQEKDWTTNPPAPGTIYFPITTFTADQLTELFGEKIPTTGYIKFTPNEQSGELYEKIKNWNFI